MKKKSNTPAKPPSLHQNGGDNGTNSASTSLTTPAPQSAKVVGIHIQQSKRSTSFPIGSLLTAILPHFDPNANDDDDDIGIARMQIDRGARFAISNMCLDFIPRDFTRAKVLFRYSYHGSDGDAARNDRRDAPWICLCHFLVGTMPMISLNLTIDGPCSMEWKLDVEGNSGVVGGSYSMTTGAHIVGNVEAISDVIHSSVSCSAGEITDRGDVVEERIVVDKEEKDGELPADGKRSNDNASSSGSGNNNVRHDAGDDGKSKKRKLCMSDNTDAEETSQISQKQQQQNQTVNATTATNGEESTTITAKKLTKKERKKLAEEKAKELEETLAAARDNSTSSRKKDDREIIAEQVDGEDEGGNEAGEPPTKKAKKKKKKKKQASKADGDDANDENENAKSKPPQAKPTSLTSQRRLPNGILLRDILIGTGAPVAPGRRVSLHYTGSLLSTGKVFDKNHSKTHPLVFRQGTGEVIRGLERGLEGMKVGGERVITVPSRLGYGEKGVDGKIPGGEDLVFEVKVLKVG